MRQPTKKQALALIGRKVINRRTGERGEITGLSSREDKPGNPAIVEIAIAGARFGGWEYLDDIIDGTAGCCWYLA
jgi:hypothetical protein